MIYHPVAITVPYRGVMIATKTALAEDFLSRVRGLLGTGQFLPGCALLIKRCSSIHTFGMKFPIDVIFLDRRDRIVRMCSQVKSGKIIRGGLGAVMVVELPAGTIAQSEIAVGDRISLT